MKYILAITITLLPSGAVAQQFTPEQMLDVMTKSLGNRDVRVQDCGHTKPIKGHHLVDPFRLTCTKDQIKNTISGATSKINPLHPD